MATATYWDASALLSVIVEDRHSTRARREAAKPEPRLVSSLAFVEGCSVLRRLASERRITSRDCKLGIESLRARPWTALHLEPNRTLVATLAARHSLRGADLWHLSVAATLAAELPGLSMLTFDDRLAAAAKTEQLA